MATERVQKILAQAGIASRRKAEELIIEGLVTINGKLAKLGDKAEWGKDAIKVKGKLLHQTAVPLYIAFHKPKGVISMLTDPENRPTLANYLHSVKERVFPIGRLDFNSEGLLLLTNDGALAEKIQKNENLLRVYSVKVKGFLTEEMLDRLKHGAKIGGEFKKRFVKPHTVRMVQELTSKAVVEISILGGSAFDIKGFFEAKGFLVEKITRTAIGHLSLQEMPPGKFRYLTASQVNALLDQPELGHRRLEHRAQKAKPVIPRKTLPLKEDKLKIISKKAGTPKKKTSTKSSTRSVSPKKRR